MCLPLFQIGLHVSIPTLFIESVIQFYALQTVPPSYSTSILVDYSGEYSIDLDFYAYIGNACLRLRAERIEIMLIDIVGH